MRHDGSPLAPRRLAHSGGARGAAAVAWHAAMPVPHCAAQQWHDGRVTSADGACAMRRPLANARRLPSDGPRDGACSLLCASHCTNRGTNVLGATSCVQCCQYGNRANGECTTSVRTPTPRSQAAPRRHASAALLVTSRYLTVNSRDTDECFPSVFRRLTAPPSQNSLAVARLLGACAAFVPSAPTPRRRHKRALPALCGCGIREAVALWCRVAGDSASR